MKNKKFYWIISIIISMFLITGCGKKVGIGSHNVFDAYYGATLTKVKRISPEYKPMTGDEDSDFILVDEKGGFSLVLQISDGKVYGVSVWYYDSYGDQNQAKLILEPPSDSKCFNSDSISNVFDDKGLWQYFCTKR